MRQRPKPASDLSLTQRIWTKRLTRYSLRDLLEMRRTPIGRRRLRKGLLFLMWPVTSRLAALYRRTLARKVRIIAVVGSLGKTTTAHAIAAALGGSVRHRLSANSLSAIPRAILRLRPWDERTVIEAGAELPPPPGRMAVKHLESGAILICDDCKSALETIHAALDVGRSAQGRHASAGSV